MGTRKKDSALFGLSGGVSLRKFTLEQSPDCCESGDRLPQQLTVMFVNNGVDNFIRISTPRWSFDPDELVEFATSLRDLCDKVDKTDKDSFEAYQRYKKMKEAREGIGSETE